MYQDQTKILEDIARYQYQKSRAPRKPLTDCLDHLRSKNGLPTGDDLNLDSFLYPDNNANNSVDSRPDNPTRSRSPGPGPITVSALLAQLFNAAHAPPKPPETPQEAGKPPNLHPSSFPIHLHRHRTPAVVHGVNIAIVEETVDNEANDGEDNELIGFSKSEVTVIDTSSPGWKGDKLLFRKDAVWKLKEKKPKSSRVSSNKKSGNEIGTSEEVRSTCKDTQDDLTGHPKERQVHSLIATCGY